MLVFKRRQENSSVSFGIKDYCRMLISYGPRLPIYYFFYSHIYDIIRSTDTHCWIPRKYERDNFYFQSRDDGVLYMASWTNTLYQAFNNLLERLGENFSSYQFVDIGCGKGRPCQILDELLDIRQIKINYPLLGIDYSQDNIRIASKNLHILNKRNSSRGLSVKFVCDDALNTHSYLEASKLIVYMYNPFNGPTLDKFLNTIKRCDVFVIYVNPVDIEVFRNANFVELFGQHKWHPNLSWKLLFRASM